MLEPTPAINGKIQRRGLALWSRKDIADIVGKINDKYLYWSDVKYAPRPGDVSAEELWAVVKMSRMLQRVMVWSKYSISIPVTNNMQRLCHEFDMNFGGSWGNNSIIPQKGKEQFLISSLMEEAISSSQMEGAATTRRVAKNMLRKNVSPTNRSEQMILNNYTSIRFIVEHKDDDLTKELLLRIHSLMTVRTLENPDDAGRFRTNDDVVVENGITHEVVHTPPSYKDIPGCIEQICDFANADSSAVFIHPIIKAIVIHFMIAYLHPFVDGNGRTARAFFYWYMLKKGYWLTEYLSISRIIYRSKAAYEKAYLETEADGNDMGYFINYNLRVLDLAFKELKRYIQRKIVERQKNVDFKLAAGVNDRQAAILALLRDDPKIILTVHEVENRFSVSRPTAKRDLDELAGMEYLTRVTINRKSSEYIKGARFDALLGE